MPIKLTLKELLSLAQAAGVPPVEIVEKAEESDFITTAESDKPISVDTLLMAIDTERGKIIEPKILQAKTGDIHSTVAGKINNALRSQISQLTGIPTSELKDMDSKEAMKAGLDFYAKTFGSDKEAIKKEMDSIMEQHSKDKQKLLSEKDAEISQWRTKYTDKEVIAKLVRDHNEAKGLPPNTNKAALAKQFRSHLDGIAVVKYNEDADDIELYRKDNPDIRLYTNESKTTYAKPSDFMKPFYSDLGLWNEDNRHINPADKMKEAQTQRQNGYTPVVKDNDGKPVNPVEAKIKAMAAYKPAV